MKKQRADELISQYKDKIFGFALGKMRDISSAEELAADIVCEVYSSFLKSKEIGNPAGYVYRIACNVYAKHIRGLYTNARYLDISELVLPVYEDGFEKNEQDDDLKRLRREISYLSERQRKIIYMHYYEDKPVAEIGKLLNISTGTVKWHLSDARQTLKEELTMEKNNDDLTLNPIEFCSMGHDGCPGSKGDTADMFDTRLKQNVAWSCYFTPLTVEEIARKLNVPRTFISDEVKILEENGYLDRLDNSKNPKYRTNMYITDERTFDGSEHKMFKAAAEKYCEEFYPQIFADFDASEDNWGLSCDGNDRNFMKYSLAMLCTWSMIKNDSEIEKYRVKRPDGGTFIAQASIAGLKAKQAEIPSPYWVCGYMRRNCDTFDSLQLDCRFSDRNNSGWRDNLTSDWQSLYDFIKSGCDKNALAPEDYKRLCDKGYVHQDKIQVVTVRDLSLWDILKEKITLSDKLASYNEEFDRKMYEWNKPHYPEHIRPIAKLYCQGCLGTGRFVPYLIETMLEKGLLTPLTDIQKKAVFSIFAYK